MPIRLRLVSNFVDFLLCELKTICPKSRILTSVTIHDIHHRFKEKSWKLLLRNWVLTWVLIISFVPYEPGCLLYMSMQSCAKSVVHMNHCSLLHDTINFLHKSLHLFNVWIKLLHMKEKVVYSILFFANTRAALLWILDQKKGKLDTDRSAAWCPRSKCSEGFVENRKKDKTP